MIISDLVRSVPDTALMVSPLICSLVQVSSPTEDLRLLAVGGPGEGEPGQVALTVQARDEQLGNEESFPASSDEETWTGDREECPA